jgi:hypothetical protein
VEIQEINYPYFEENEFLLYYGDNLDEAIKFYEKKYNSKPEKVYFDSRKKLIIFISEEINKNIRRI